MQAVNGIGDRNGCTEIFGAEKREKGKTGFGESLSELCRLYIILFGGSAGINSVEVAGQNWDSMILPGNRATSDR